MGDDSAIGFPVSWVKGPAVQRRTKLEADNTGWEAAVSTGATTVSTGATTVTTLKSPTSAAVHPRRARPRPGVGVFTSTNVTGRRGMDQVGCLMVGRGAL
jgi:hypothetical protein